MKRLLITVAMLLCAGAASAQAQGRGPGIPPAGQRGPGGPAGVAAPSEPEHKRAEAGKAAPHAGPRNGLQFGPAGRWWDDRNTVKTVGITPVQQRKMDSVFAANKPAILATYKALLAEQARLSELNKAPQPDQAAVFAQIDAVNQARGALQKATTQMLLQIRQEMGTEQVQKLEQIQ